MLFSEPLIQDLQIHNQDSTPLDCPKKGTSALKQNPQPNQTDESSTKLMLFSLWADLMTKITKGSMGKNPLAIQFE
jgi:hypothetical protein